jgi:signal transduction histidine kinase
MSYSHLADVTPTAAPALHTAPLQETGFHTAINAVECANELLDCLTEPVLLLVPVWNETQHVSTIIDFQVGYANQVAVTTFGMGKGQLLRQQGGDNTGNDPFYTAWFNLLALVHHTGESATGHYRHTTTEKEFQLQCNKVSQGILTLARDITHEVQVKKEREEKAHQISQQYDERVNIIFNTAHAGMYTLAPVRDEKGEIIDFRFGLVNQAVATYLGLTAADLAGSLGSQYFPAYKTNGLFDRYVETINTGEPAQFDLHYADGYDNFFTINVVKMEDEILATFIDHSTLKRLQRELEASITELKRSNASLEQFAHAASHDLQEPLRRIMLYADKLESGHADELSDEAFGHIERIQTAGKRMRRLIQDLLVFAEVGANRNAFEEVDLNRLVQDVINDLEVAITERDAEVTLEGLGKIKGDSLHLQQLFQNLISNSLKYSRLEAAPKIRISSTTTRGKDAAGFALAAHESEKQYWLIELSDNGQGFDQEQATQIFKIFQRLPQHRTEYTGTGIGLAIVQRVVENHSGYIRAEGVPGEGATFKILLPVLE